MAESTKSARELNEDLLYTLYATLSVSTRLPEGRLALVEETEAFVEAAGAKGVYVRGFYDLAAMRADADVLLWWTCPDPEVLQEAYARFRRTRLGTHLQPVWSVVGLHRPAEFNRNHIPAFVRREDPKRWVSVYPFNRSLEWYLLPDYERRGMLAEHGQMGREFEDVRANTVAAFGLGDYEWLLAFEADDLHRIVDCLRHLRESTARRHTRLETPFYTGSRKSVSDLVAALP
jgi:peroxiredoxin